MLQAQWGAPAPGSQPLHQPRLPVPRGRSRERSVRFLNSACLGVILEVVPHLAQGVRNVAEAFLRLREIIHRFGDVEAPMARLRCKEVAPGLRSSERVAIFADVEGRDHFLRVEGDFLYREGEQALLPVAVVHRDPATGYLLVELPHEAETGANRVWVAPDQVEGPVEAVA